MNWLALVMAMALVSRGLTAGAFEDIQIDGHCNKANTEIIENGMTLSVIFNDLSVNMPLGVVGEGKRVAKNCVMKVKINYPPDCYLGALKQVFTGGVIKSKNSLGHLIFNSMVGGRMANPAPMRWGMGDEILPEDADSTFTREAVADVPEPRGCKGELRFVTRLNLHAVRHSVDRDMFLGGVDSLDSEFAQKLDLVPVWKPCRPRR